MFRLQILALDSNRLTRLPPEIGDVYCLERLSVTANRLEQLPPELSKLGRLRDVHTDVHSPTVG